jgi:hypothetical protein
MSSFVKRVNASMSKVDPLLKTLQVRPVPPEALVQAYLIHIADRSDNNFRKILDLKGIRKADQAALLDLFSAFRQSPSNENLAANSPLLTPLQIPSGHIGTGIGSLGNAGAIGTPGLAGGRFDPATFGSALINAARDGVDRFGSPALGSSATMGGGQQASGGQAQQAEGPTANLNDNLKNIGKFFRRDMSSFGRFGRSNEEGR